MKLSPIVNSLLENDFYKWNMGNAIFLKCNGYTTEWSFKERNNVSFTPEMIAEIREQVAHYCTLRYTEDELEYLKKVAPWLSKGYLDFLRFWHPRRCEIFVNEGNIRAYNDCGLAIEAHGTWLNTSMYEVPILAIVNEVYFAFTYGEGTLETVFVENAVKKFDRVISGEIDLGNYADFGMRRRYSAKMQDWVVKYQADKKTTGELPGFVGTSNVFLAKKYGVKPIGTMAHEFAMCVAQGDPTFNSAFTNARVMQLWTDVYGTENGIMLNDTLGDDVFLLDFTKKFATLFAGIRHDSGDPFAWGEKMLAHYQKLGIDPKTKTLLFSDSLNFDKADALKKHFDGRCQIAFGIGTYITCDLGDLPANNIVLKVTKCNGYPVAKISNDLGKSMCKDGEYVAYLKRCIEWRLAHECM